MALIKKKFFEIDLPLINQKADLIATNEQELKGKTVKIDLTRRLRGKSLEITFRLISEKDKIIAEPYRLHLLGYFIRRMMRKSIDYVEDSFSAESKNAVLRVKPFLITRQKVSRKIRNALRKKTKEEIENSIRNENFEGIFSEIIANRFQRALSLKLKKVYPLSLCEIRDIFVEKKQELEVKKEKIE